MCNHLTVLAQDRDVRVVAQCEHGALHLSWDIATLRLQPRDFLILARFFDTCAPRAADALIVDGWCRLARDSNGAARLWIGQAGLALAPDDLASLSALVARAAAVLQTAADRAGVATHALRDCPRLAINAQTLGRN